MVISWFGFLTNWFWNLKLFYLYSFPSISLSSFKLSSYYNSLRLTFKTHMSFQAPYWSCLICSFGNLVNTCKVHVSLHNQWHLINTYNDIIQWPLTKFLSFLLYIKSYYKDWHDFQKKNYKFRFLKLKSICFNQGILFILKLITIFIFQQSFVWFFIYDIYLLVLIRSLLSYFHSNHINHSFSSYLLLMF